MLGKCHPAQRLIHFLLVPSGFVILLLKVNVWRFFKGHTSYKMAHNRLMQLCNISIFNVSFKVCCDVKESSRSLFSKKKKKQSYVMFITGKKKKYTGHCKIRFLSLEISVFLLSLFLCLSFSLTVNGFRGTISINLPNWSNKWLLIDSPTRRCYRLHNELRPAIPHPHHVFIDFQSSSKSILHNQYQTGASI